MTGLKTLNLVLLAAVFLAGCGGQEPSAPVPPPPAPPLPSPPSAPEAVPPDAALPTVEMEEVAETPPVMNQKALHETLIGTSWRVGDLQLKFLDESKVFAKGGMIAELSIEGITATYTLEDGKITATAAGRSVVGAWDGQRLIFAGQEGVRQPQ